MGIIKIENLKAGMVLAADVRDRSGRLLLGAGTEIADRHLHILRTWGITEVESVGSGEVSEEADAPEAEDSALWQEMEAKIAPLFTFSDMEHPAIKELIRLRILQEVNRARG